MRDHIDRQKVIDKAVEFELFGEKVKFVAVSEIEKIPSAQPKRGKWQYNGKHGTFKIYTCDKCGWNSEAEFNFCPNCGAKMEATT